MFHSFSIAHNIINRRHLQDAAFFDILFVQESMCGAGLLRRQPYPGEGKSTGMELCFRVPDQEGTQGVLLRNFLRRCAVSSDLSRGVKFQGGGFFADDRPVLANQRVFPGQVVRFALPPQGAGVRPQPEIGLRIVYEDPFALLVDKPAGLAVHPTLNYPEGTLANGYAAWALEHGVCPVFRPVNRIDKDTSGLVLAAKHAYAAPLLAQRVQKLYYAVPQGELPLGPGVIDAPIGRRGDSIIGRCVTPEGKPSRTEYEILRAENGLSLAACLPVTGRTHQIRVHFAHLGHPLAGDDLYGGSRERIGRQALHCARQTFWLPQGRQEGERLWIDAPQQLHSITVECPLPPDIQALFW